MWKLLLAEDCGSSTEPLEYIVSIWAHYPIGGVNKEGIPLSQLPQQRRKGEEQGWWEEKWSEGRGGVHCEGRGGHCLPVTVGNGKAWVIRACVSVFRKCVCMWACVNEWTWLSVRWRGSMRVYVCVRSLQFGMSELGGRSKDAQTKLDFFTPPFLSFLNGDWGLAGFLYSCCLAELCFRVSVVHVRFKPPKLPVTQDWLRESLLLDLAGQWLREPCDRVVTATLLILSKWKMQEKEAMKIPSVWMDHSNVSIFDLVQQSVLCKQHLTCLYLMIHRCD